MRITNTSVLSKYEVTTTPPPAAKAVTSPAPAPEQHKTGRTAIIGAGKEFYKYAYSARLGDNRCADVLNGESPLILLDANNVVDILNGCNIAKQEYENIGIITRMAQSSSFSRLKEETINRIPNLLLEAAGYRNLQDSAAYKELESALNMKSARFFLFDGYTKYGKEKADAIEKAVQNLLKEINNYDIRNCSLGMIINGIEYNKKTSEKQRDDNMNAGRSFYEFARSAKVLNGMCAKIIEGKHPKIRINIDNIVDILNGCVEQMKTNDNIGIIKLLAQSNQFSGIDAKHTDKISELLLKAAEKRELDTTSEYKNVQKAMKMKSSRFLCGYSIYGEEKAEALDNSLNQLLTRINIHDSKQKIYKTGLSKK